MLQRVVAFRPKRILEGGPMLNCKSPQEELTRDVGAGPNLDRGRFVARGLYLESMVLIASMRHAAEELHDWALRSRSFLVESEVFLAERSKVAHAKRHIASRSN